MSIRDLLRRGISRASARPSDSLGVIYRTYKERFPEERWPRLFAVPSWGRAGNAWAAKLLNAHPDVLATCGGRTVTRVVADTESQLSTEHFLRCLEFIGLPYRLVGDLHGIHAHEVPELQKIFGRQFRACGLVRHPVPRFASSVAPIPMKTDRRSFQEFLEGWNLTPDSPTAKIVREELGEDANCRPAEIMMLVSGVHFEQRNLGRLFTMEEITQSARACDELLQHLSDGELSFPASILEQQLGVQAGGVMREGSALNSPKAEWDALPENYRGLFVRMLSDEARAIYSSLGYDLSFVSASP